MDNKPILKLIDIDQQLLDARDVGAVVGLCVDLEEDPEFVRMFQGTVGFRFPGQEERGIELWDDPGIQGWGREAYRYVPHLLYYMDPEPGLGALALAIGSRHPFEAGDDLRATLAHPLVAMAAFAERMADPWEPILERLLNPLDPELAAETKEIVAASMALAAS